MHVHRSLEVLLRLQDNAAAALQSAPGVVQLYRTPALTASATSKLQAEAHAAGLTSISGIATELVRAYLRSSSAPLFCCHDDTLKVLCVFAHVLIDGDGRRCPPLGRCLFAWYPSGAASTTPADTKLQRVWVRRPLPATEPTGSCVLHARMVQHLVLVCSASTSTLASSSTRARPRRWRGCCERRTSRSSSRLPARCLSPRAHALSRSGHA